MFRLLKSHLLTFSLGLSLLAVYLAFRLPNLTLQPIFADEAIYIRWAQIMKSEPSLRFLPLSDGKTPLFMWMMMPLFKIFDDPLFAGRFLSALAGVGTLSGVFILGWKFFNKSVGILSALFVAVTPYIVFFDRMALVDSMLAAFSVWSLLLALLLIRYQRIDLSLFLGYLLGGAMITKTPGFFNILVLPMTLITFNWFAKNRQLKLLKQFGLWIISVATAMGIYNILRLGPGFVNLNSRNQDYIFSPERLLSNPLDPFIPHLNDILDWFPKLLTFPLSILLLISIFWVFYKRNLTAITILVWALIPLIIQTLLLKTFTARYILFSMPPLLIVSAFALIDMVATYKNKIKWFLPIFLGLFLSFAIMINSNFLFSPEKANLSKGERTGYFEDWTAGYGLKEIAQYLIDQSQKGLVVVGTEGSFGTLPDGLQIYLEKHAHTVPAGNQVIVMGGTATISAQLLEATKDHPTYFVANKSRFNKTLPYLELVKEYPKFKGPNSEQDAILLFKLNPQTKSNQ